MDAAAVVVPVTADRWADVESVFGGRGDPARCWCQWFHAGAHVARGAVAARNRDALCSQVRQGPPGVLAYRDGAPVGWCAVAPRPTYTRLPRTEVLRGTPPAELADPAVWSVTCFVVRVGHRRGGLSRVLLFHGALSTFLSAGFREVARARPARPVVRLELPG
jgi:hypothetical protein